MVYTERIEKAINFMIQIHEIDAKQKRKGKDVPHIVHPLSAAIILSKVGANEDLIIAGLLHDSIEDTTKDRSIVKEMIKENFGENVYNIVSSVTEEENLEWEERKAIALSHIKDYSYESLLLKSSDLICNVREVYTDYQERGDSLFEIFSRGKVGFLGNANNVIKEILKREIENPLKDDLLNLFELLTKMNFDIHK